MSNFPYWIKERHNPQLGVYYVAKGQMSKTAAKKYEKPLYGSDIMHRYENEIEYVKAIEKLQKQGDKVQ